ncbi:YbdD/YjiX family protein [Kribbella sp. NBC_01245]|uniref:YbdD/YjiX family protein n=1 Tax=Kribbella sp. NBC_01245 TaxID=2903578 RepID=UPI002E28F3A4|nr:YbdD/YjiX family protein [Kribbella sp. NBC_01245]
MTASVVVRAWRGLRWYLREVSGESAYDRYVETACRKHPDEAPLDRRAFERRRQDLENQRPQQRCC